MNLDICDQCNHNPDILESQGAFKYKSNCLPPEGYKASSSGACECDPTSGMCLNSCGSLCCEKSPFSSNIESSDQYWKKHPDYKEGDKLSDYQCFEVDNSYNFSNLENQYKINTTKMVESVELYNKRYDLKKKLNNKITDSEIDIDELQNLTETNKRKIEINLNTFRSIKNQNNILKYVLVFVILLIVIPVLGKLGFITKSVAIIVWLSAILIIFCVVFYFLILNK